MPQYKLQTMFAFTALAAFSIALSLRFFSTAARHEKLIHDLSTIPVIEGASLGGPYVGILHNATTEQICAEGNDIVPRLIKEVECGKLIPCIYCLFCLREIGATDATPSILKLKADLEKGVRFSTSKHQRDYTIEMQIELYLKVLQIKQ